MYPMTVVESARAPRDEGAAGRRRPGEQGRRDARDDLPAQGRAARVGDVRRGPRRFARTGTRSRLRHATASASPRAASRCSAAASPQSPPDDDGERPRLGHGQAPEIVAELDYESLTLAQLRARLTIAARRRPRGAAGLRGVDQGARPVPDAAGQQDHPRDRQVTARRTARASPRTIRGRSAPSPLASPRTGSTGSARCGSRDRSPS